MTALDQRQRIAPGRAGEPVVAVSPTQTLAVDETQDGGHPVSVGQPLGYLPPTLPRKTGGGQASPVFFPFPLRARFNAGTRFWRAGRILPIGWPAANLCRAIMRRGSQFQLGNHLVRQDLDLPKTYHVNALSSIPFAYVDEHRAVGGRRNGNLFQRA